MFTSPFLSDGLLDRTVNAWFSYRSSERAERAPGARNLLVMYLVCRVTSCTSEGSRTDPLPVTEGPAG